MILLFISAVWLVDDQNRILTNFLQFEPGRSAVVELGRPAVRVISQLLGDLLTPPFGEELRDSSRPEGVVGEHGRDPGSQ